MNLEKRQDLIALYDLYKGLLTEKQQSYFEAYYFDDLSFAEIAENFNVSRNAAFDQIKKVAINLDKYESILKLNYKNKILEESLNNDDINSLKDTIKKLLKE